MLPSHLPLVPAAGRCSLPACRWFPPQAGISLVSVAPGCSFFSRDWLGLQAKGRDWLEKACREARAFIRAEIARVFKRKNRRQQADVELKRLEEFRNVILAVVEKAALFAVHRSADVEIVSLAAMTEALNAAYRYSY